MPSSDTNLDRILRVVALGFTAVVYAPITRGYFFADDFIQLYALATRPVMKFILQPYGGNFYLARNAVFALSYRLFGTDAALYFWTVLLLHLVNVALLFSVIRRLTNSPYLSCFGSTMWGINPTNAGSLSWYSAFGHVTAATALLVLLIDVTRRAEEGRAATSRVFLYWGFLAFVAASSYGVGFGAALAVPIALWLVFDPDRLTHRWYVAIACFPIALIGTYAGMMWISEWYLGDEVPSGIRQLKLMPLANPKFHAFLGRGATELLLHGSTDLILGFVKHPGVHPTPALGWTVAGGLLCMATVCIVLGPRRSRRRMFAAIVLLTASYGILVLGRAALLGVRDVGAVERYHYLPSIALVLVLCLGLHRVGTWIRCNTRTSALLLCLWLVAAATAFARSDWTIHHHERERRVVARALAIVDAHLDADDGDVADIENRDVGLNPLAVRMRQTFLCPRLACVFTIFHPSNVVNGRRVRFLETDPKTLEYARRYQRSRELIVPMRRHTSEGGSAPDTLPPGATRNR